MYKKGTTIMEPGKCMSSIFDPMGFCFSKIPFPAYAFLAKRLLNLASVLNKKLDTVCLQDI
jgi:hypothetical protein